MLKTSHGPATLSSPVLGLLAACLVGQVCHAGTFPLVQGSPYDFEICGSANTDRCFEYHALSPLTFDGLTETFTHDTAGDVEVSETVTHLGGAQYQVTITFQSPVGADLYPAGGTDSSGNPLTFAGLGLGHLDHPFQLQTPVRLDSAMVLAHSPLIPPPFPNPFPFDFSSPAEQTAPWDGRIPGDNLVQLVRSDIVPVLGLNIQRVDAILTMTAIPEPGTLMLLGWCKAILLCRRRPC